MPRRQSRRPYADVEDPPHPDPWPEPKCEGKYWHNLHLRFPILMSLNAHGIRMARAAEQKAVEDKIKSERAHRDALVPQIRLETVSSHQGIVLRGPTVLESRWRDPEDKNLSTRTPKMVNGYSSDVLKAMYDAGRKNPDNADDDTGKIKRAHMNAARQYRLDYELGVHGGQPGKGFDLSGVRSGYDQKWVEHLRLNRMARFRRVNQKVGDNLAGILKWVVLDNQYVSSWAIKHGYSKHNAMGYLLGALDALADAYGEGKKTAAR